MEEEEEEREKQKGRAEDARFGPLSLEVITQTWKPRR